MTVAASFNTLRSPDRSYELVVSPEAGGSISALRKAVDGKFQDVLRAFNPAALATANSPMDIALQSGSFPMTPYTNRIKDCRLTVNGETLYVGPPHGSEPNALHGDGWKSAWSVEALGDHSVTLFLRSEPRTGAGADNTPYGYETRQIFTLGNDGLAIDMEITNRSGRTLPFGVGQHTYFDLIDGATILTADLGQVWAGGENMIPVYLRPLPAKWDFSQGSVLSEARLGPAEEGFYHTDLMDNCFTGFKGTATVAYPGKNLLVSLKADPAVFGKAVMYVPSPRPDFFAFELVPNVIDGFNKSARGVPDTGAWLLADNETRRAGMRIEARALRI